MASHSRSLNMNSINRGRLKQRFDLIRKLGQGTYGKVQLGIDKVTGQEVALKTIKKSKIENDVDLLRIKREINIMSCCNHPNIIHIYEVFENREKIILVMEYAAGGELYDYLNERKKLNEGEAKRLFSQIASAIYYCHKHYITHRDIKLENVLLDINFNAKIADFGLSNVYGEELLATFCGSPLYASPEIVKGIPYHGPEVDCWSLGVLLYTLIYGSMPFDGSNFKKLVKQITTSTYYEPPLRSGASDLIRALLTVDPRRRLTILQLVGHPWLQSTDCQTVSEEYCNLAPAKGEFLIGINSRTEDTLDECSEISALDAVLEDDRVDGEVKGQNEPMDTESPAIQEPMQSERQKVIVEVHSGAELKKVDSQNQQKEKPENQQKAKSETQEKGISEAQQTAKCELQAKAKSEHQDRAKSEFQEKANFETQEKGKSGIEIEKKGESVNREKAKSENPEKVEISAADLAPPPEKQNRLTKTSSQPRDLCIAPKPRRPKVAKKAVTSALPELTTSKVGDLVKKLGTAQTSFINSKIARKEPVKKISPPPNVEVVTKKQPDGELVWQVPENMPVSKIPTKPNRKESKSEKNILKIQELTPLSTSQSQHKDAKPKIQKFVPESAIPGQELETKHLHQAKVVDLELKKVEVEVKGQPEVENLKEPLQLKPEKISSDTVNISETEIVPAEQSEPVATSSGAARTYSTVIPTIEIVEHENVEISKTTSASSNETKPKVKLRKKKVVSKEAKVEDAEIEAPPPPQQPTRIARRNSKVISQKTAELIQNLKETNKSTAAGSAGGKKIIIFSSLNDVKKKFENKKKDEEVAPAMTVRKKSLTIKVDEASSAMDLNKLKFGRKSNQDLTQKSEKFSQNTEISIPTESSSEQEKSDTVKTEKITENCQNLAEIPEVEKVIETGNLNEVENLKTEESVDGTLKSEAKVAKSDSSKNFDQDSKISDSNATKDLQICANSKINTENSDFSKPLDTITSIKIRKLSTPKISPILKTLSPKTEKFPDEIKSEAIYIPKVTLNKCVDKIEKSKTSEDTALVQKTLEGENGKHSNDMKKSESNKTEVGFDPPPPTETHERLSQIPVPQSIKKATSNQEVSMPKMSCLQRLQKAFSTKQVKNVSETTVPPKTEILNVKTPAQAGLKLFIPSYSPTHAGRIPMPNTELSSDRAQSPVTTKQQAVDTIGHALTKIKSTDSKFGREIPIQIENSDEIKTDVGQNQNFSGGLNLKSYSRQSSAGDPVCNGPIQKSRREFIIPITYESKEQRGEVTPSGSSPSIGVYNSRRQSSSFSLLSPETTDVEDEFFENGNDAMSPDYLFTSLLQRVRGLSQRIHDSEHQQYQMPSTSRRAPSPSFNGTSRESSLSDPVTVTVSSSSGSPKARRQLSLDDSCCSSGSTLPRRHSTYLSSPRQSYTPSYLTLPRFKYPSVSENGEESAHNSTLPSESILLQKAVKRDPAPSSPSQISKFLNTHLGKFYSKRAQSDCSFISPSSTTSSDTLTSGDPTVSTNGQSSPDASTPSSISDRILRKSYYNRYNHLPNYKATKELSANITKKLEQLLNDI